MEGPRNVLCEYSLNVPAEGSLSIPLERSIGTLLWNVQKTRNFLSSRNVPSTLQWNLPNVQGRYCAMGVECNQIVAITILQYILSLEISKLLQ